MHPINELLPGIYLAEIYAGRDENLIHYFTVFCLHEDRNLVDTAKAVLQGIQEDYLPVFPEQVRTARVALVKDSLWGGLQEHLQGIREQDGCWIHHVSLRHSWQYEMEDYSELAICLMNLANQPQECEAALDGLMADPGEAALSCVLACLETVRKVVRHEETSKIATEFPAVLEAVTDARLEVMRQREAQAPDGLTNH